MLIDNKLIECIGLVPCFLDRKKIIISNVNDNIDKTLKKITNFINSGITNNIIYMSQKILLIHKQMDLLLLHYHI